MKRSTNGALGAAIVCLAVTLAQAAHSRLPVGDPLAGAPGIAGSGDSSSAGDRERIDAGFAMTPVPLDMQGKNPRLVGLGSYLVNAVGACHDCHTNPSYLPGGDPYQGQPIQINTANFLAGGKLFGPFVSSNLTPDANGLPTGRTLEQFMSVMRQGLNLNCQPGDPPPHCPLLHVMPWPNFQDSSDGDLQAIYEYLSAIPHAEPGTAP